MLAAIAKRWFLCLLTAGIALAWFAPGALRWTAALDPRLIIAAALLLMAWSLPSRSLAHEIAHPAPALWGLVLSYSLVPTVAWLLGSWLLPDDLATGLMIAASGPCTLAAAVLWTRLAKGNEATALLVIFLTTALSWLLTPFWLTLATSQ